MKVTVFVTAVLATLSHAVPLTPSDGFEFAQVEAEAQFLCGLFGCKPEPEPPE